MLRQIELGLQNGPITKFWSFASNYVFFWKICSSFRTSSKKLVLCTNDPNINIRLFRKGWSLVLGCFFPVSILNKTLSGCFFSFVTRSLKATDVAKFFFKL